MKQASTAPDGQPGPANTGAKRRRRSITPLKTLITFGLAAYAIIAIAGDLFSPNGEWFPVFSWSLFSKVSAHGYATRLEIVAIDGAPLEQSKFYRDLGSVFPKAGAASISMNKLLDKIAVDHHIGAPNEGRLRILRSRYLTNVESVEWRIVRIVTDPIEHYKTGAISMRHVWLEGAFPTETIK